MYIVYIYIYIYIYISIYNVHSFSSVNESCFEGTTLRSLSLSVSLVLPFAEFQTSCHDGISIVSRASSTSESAFLDVRVHHKLVRLYQSNMTTYYYEWYRPRCIICGSRNTFDCEKFFDWQVDFIMLKEFQKFFFLLHGRRTVTSSMPENLAGIDVSTQEEPILKPCNVLYRSVQ